MVIVIGLIASALLAGATTETGAAWPFVKLLFVLAVMVFLLRERVIVGLALLVGAVSLGIAFRVPQQQLAHGFVFGIFDPAATELHAFGMGAVRVSLMVFLINLLSRLLILGGGVKVLIESLERLFRDARWVMAAIPAVMGLLPMPGGALVSAPMVGEVGARLDLRPVEKSAINFWFRHIWEWFWPLYPAILILLEDGYLTMPQILAYHGPLTVAAIATGWFFLLRKIARPHAETGRTNYLHDITRVLSVMWPMLFVVASVLLIRLPEPYNAWVLPGSLVLVDIVLIFVTHLGGSKIMGAILHAAQWKILLLIFGVYVLRCVFVLAGAPEKLPLALDAMHVPVILACFIVPFIINLITGYNLAGVSMAFPLLAALFIKTGPSGVVAAYAGAFIGVLASPVHLCLVLTREYFQAEWSRVYRLLIPMLICMLIIAAIIVLVI